MSNFKISDFLSEVFAFNAFNNHKNCSNDKNFRDNSLILSKLLKESLVKLKQIFSFSYFSL